jgi:hypothetical protein
MTHVRAYQLGPYSDWSQRLLNELASAKICLLTPDRKTAYDAELRKKMAAGGDAAATSAVAAGNGGSTFGADSDGDELDLAPESPSSFGGSSSRIRSSDSRVSRRKASLPSREMPSAIGVGKAAPADAQKLAAAAKPVPKPSPPSLPPAESPVLPAAPATAWHYEPPYMVEYRRKFFENFVRVCILLFVLGLALILFTAFVLPLFKESVAPPVIPPGAPTVEPPSAPPAVPSAPIEAPPPAPPSVATKASGENGEPVGPPPAGVTEQPAERPKAAFSRASPAAKTTATQISDAEAFVGRWRTYEDGRYISTITLLADHSARDSRHPTMAGVWDLSDGEVVIEWKDGWRQVWRQDGKVIRTMSFSPDDPDELRPVNEGTAVKGDSSSER